MAKVTQTQEDLQRHLDEQLHFLSRSAQSYDEGYEAEAKRMAVTLRVLLHDTNDSKSLLAQLGKKDTTDFYDTGIPSRPGMLNFGASLVVLPTNNNGKAIPFLDESPSDTSGYVKFQEYWHRPILFAGQKHFTRKDLVTAVANKDGGAHIDPKLDEEYANLSRNNSFGWKVGSSTSPEVPVGIVELASIRQIAHEILRTLMPTYPHKNMKHGGGPLMFPRIFFIGPEESSD